MKIKTLAGLILVGFLLSGFGQPTATSNQQKDPTFETITDDPNLPRVLLIGDSISMGYTVPVRNLLKGKANVHRIPENGGPTTNGLAKLKAWLGERKWDVIHFNWGLHDLRIISDGRRQVSLEAYEKNLRQLVVQLKGTRAKLIWATTTPVPEGANGRRSADAPLYNAIAKKIMEENRVAIDDLYTFALPQLSKIQRSANVHFTEEGSEALAKQVARSIEAALTEKK